MKKLLKISALALTLIALVTAPFALGAKTSASAMRTAQPPVPETQVFSAQAFYKLRKSVACYRVGYDNSGFVF